MAPEKKDKEPSGSVGPPPVPRANPSDVLKVLHELGQQVDKLDKNVDGERDARIKETISRDRQATRFKVFAVVATFFVVISLTAAIASYNTAKSESDNRKADQARNTKQNEKLLATVVGGCAVANINRISNINMLADTQQLRPFVPTNTMDEFIEKWTKEWQPVECRALVSDDIGVQLCLQYPPQLDPDTGLPVPTTIDPINAKACPNLEKKAADAKAKQDEG